MASGMPSSCSQIAATWAALSFVTVKFGRPRTARSTNSRTASNDPRLSMSVTSSARGADHRRHPPRDLAGQVQRLAARGQHLKRWATAQQRLHQRRRLIEQVLAVVDDDQRTIVTQTTDHRVEQRSVTRLLQVEHLGQRAHHRARLAERRELDVPDAVAVAIPDRSTARSARRVLPHPPDPVMVSRRVSSSSAWSCASSGSRPMNGVSGVGRLLVMSTPPRNGSDLVRRGSCDPFRRSVATWASAMWAQLNRSRRRHRGRRPARDGCAGSARSTTPPPTPPTAADRRRPRSRRRSSPSGSPVHRARPR